MIFGNPIPFEEAARAAEVKQVLPNDLGSDQLRRLSKELRRRAIVSAHVKEHGHAQLLKDLIKSIAGGPSDADFAARGRGEQPLLMSVPEAKALLRENLERIGYHAGERSGGIQDLASERRTQMQLETGVLDVLNYGRRVRGQSAAALDQFPALELVRVGPDPKTPRDWPDRWRSVGGKFYGDRMIALKNDDVWARLGSEFPDSLGNPWAPFAFGSHMNTIEVGREECEALGVPLRDQEPEYLGLNDNVEITADQFDQSLVATLAERADLELDGDVLRLKGDG